MPTLYALLVGITDYPKRPLKGCLNDVRAIRTFLEQRLSDNYTLKIKTLRNEDATYSAVCDAFQSHLTQAHSENHDMVLFYFSGHGSWEPTDEIFRYVDEDKGKKNETLVLHDSRSRLDGKDLADKELRYLISHVARQCDHIVVILDCCYSGHGSREERNFTKRYQRQRTQARPLAEYIFHHRPDSPINEAAKCYDEPYAPHLLFAACQDYETANERYLQSAREIRGLYTYHLLEALYQHGLGLTYHALAQKVASAFLNRISQNSTLEAINGADAYRSVFQVLPTPRFVHYTLRYVEEKGWSVDGGRVHGFRTAHEKTALEFSLYDLQATTHLPLQAIGKAYTRRIGLAESLVKVDLPHRVPNATTDIFMAVPYAELYTETTLWIDTHGNSVALERIRTLLAEPQPQRLPLLLTLVPYKQRADYVLTADNRHYQLKQLNDLTLLQKIPLTHSNALNILYASLAKIGRWHTLKMLTNPATWLPTNAIQVELKRAGTHIPLRTPRLPLTKKQSGEWCTENFNIFLTNTTADNLYCLVLNLGDTYAVNPLGEPFKVEARSQRQVSHTSFCADLPKALYRRGVRQRQELFKIIVSTKPLDSQVASQLKEADIHLMPMPGRGQLQSRGSVPKQVLPHRLPYLLFGLRHRGMKVLPDAETEINDYDWTTVEMTLKTFTPP